MKKIITQNSIEIVFIISDHHDLGFWFCALVSDYLKEETLKHLFQERFSDQSHLVN